jgi:6-phosphogluconolactonase
MTMRVRAGLTMILAVATMGLASCDHYNCASGPNLGTSCTSTATGTGVGTTGTTGTTSGATSAFVFAGDSTGTIDSDTLSASTFAATSGYTGPTAPANIAVVGMAVAQGLYLYAVYYEAGEIFGWSIGSDGSLTAIAGSPFPASYLLNSAQPGGWQTMITNPTGTLLFVEDLGGTAIYTYQIGQGGVLTAANNGSPLIVPGLPENLAIDGLGKFLYVTLEPVGDIPEVGAYAINSSGPLTAVPGTPFSYPMYQVHGEPSGKYLIGTASDSAISSLYVFNIQSTGTNAGAISPVTGAPFPTVYPPYSIAVQPNTGGDLIYSFSLSNTTTTTGSYNPIEGYQLNTSTGALTAISGSPFTVSSGNLGQFDQSGTWLSVYSVSGGTAQLGVLAVGSGGALTQPVSAVDLTALGPWVITDPN